MKTRTMTRQLLVPVFAMGILAHALFYAGDTWSAPSCDSDSAVLKVSYEDIARGKILVTCNSETYKNPSVNDNGYPYSHRLDEGTLESHPENQGFVFFNLLGGGGDIESAWNVEKDGATAKKFRKMSCGTNRMCWVQDDADGTHYRVLKKDGTTVDFEGSLPASPPSGSVALVNTANDRQFVAADKFPTEVLDFELVYDGVDVKGFVPLLYRDSNGIARSSTPDSFPRVGWNSNIIHGPVDHGILVRVAGGATLTAGMPSSPRIVNNQIMEDGGPEFPGEVLVKSVVL